MTTTEAALQHDIVAKMGAHYSYGQDRLGQGREQAKAFLDEHHDIAREIEEDVYAVAGAGIQLADPIEHEHSGELTLAAVA